MALGSFSKILWLKFCAKDQLQAPLLLMFSNESCGRVFFFPLTLEAMLFVVPASSLEYTYVARPQIVPGELLVNGTCNSMPGWCARVNTATVTCLLAILG